MKNRKIIKSLFNFSALLFIIIMLLPTIIQFTHVFEEHEQTDCNVVTTHIHKHELECSTCDFNLNQNYYSSNQDYQDTFITYQKKVCYKLYNFKYYHQHLSYSLRGPPELLT